MKGTNAMANVFSMEGRATRRVFWMYILKIQLPLQCVAFVLFLPIILAHKTACIKFNDLAIYEIIGCLLAMLLSIIAWLTSLGISVRRLHDLNFSGKWLILLMVLNGIPYVRGFAFVVGVVLLGGIKGNESENRYGPVESRETL